MKRLLLYAALSLALFSFTYSHGDVKPPRKLNRPAAVLPTAKAGARF